MKYILEEMSIPLTQIRKFGGEISYLEGNPEIKIKDFDSAKFGNVEIEIYVSRLPDRLQKLWKDFKNEVERWVKENIEKNKEAKYAAQP